MEKMMTLIPGLIDKILNDDPPTKSIKLKNIDEILDIFLRYLTDLNIDIMMD